MRLLQTTNLRLEEFFVGSGGLYSAKSQVINQRSGNQGIPEYAILSHTWGTEEISFQDITGDISITEKKAGFGKLRNSCKQARADGYAYIWIDTCCIDKTSSAELSEAINSMYQWYKDSATCYVYLSDVVVHPEVSVSMHPRHPFYTEDGIRYSSSSPYSRWFSRGWTLQELLAPSKLQFFDKNWSSIGMKEDHMDAISGITNIDLFALSGGDLRRLSIARRMSWAANRQTTRVEDTAYCLLGIFNINMPLLYGEGTNAFIRLQEEILKVTNDQSLFAWKYPTMEFYRDDDLENRKPQGLLAPSPEVFQHSDTISQFYSETPGRSLFVSTNKGFQVEFLMCQDMGYPSGLVYLAMLNCPIGHIPGRLPAIHLKRLSSSSEQYIRVDMSQLFIFSSYDSTGQTDLEGFDPRKPQRQLVEVHSRALVLGWNVQTIFIKQDSQFALPPGFWLVIPELFLESDIVVSEAYPRNLWDPTTRVLQPQIDLRQGIRNLNARKLGALLIRVEHVDSYMERVRITDYVLIFGVTYGGLIPWCHLNRAAVAEDGKLSFGPQEQAGNFQATHTNTYLQRYLQREFDNFYIDPLSRPTDLTTRRHVHICDDRQLVTIAELKTVSGKEVYLLYLITMSKYREEIVLLIKCQVYETLEKSNPIAIQTISYPQLVYA
ncbi:HET-domain-containing protein [Stipitochalara longipes BDJ]|nr:HET-domain-containing protein [Stipitochalara longipes BDJ]